MKKKLVAMTLVLAMAGTTLMEKTKLSIQTKQ